MKQKNKDAKTGILDIVSLANEMSIRWLVVLCDDVDSSAFAIEHDAAVHQRKQRIVVALTNPFSGVPFITNLADKNVASHNALAAKLLYTTTLGIRVATVATGALSLFMGH